MSADLLCCPLCSVLHPHATPDGGTGNGHFTGPQLWRGRRSGKFWLHRRLSCKHGPANESAHEKAEDVTGPWNAWAEAEAREKAKRLKFGEERALLWLYELGVGRLEDVVAG